VTIGSVQEAKPHPDMLVYSSSKAAQTGMAKSLALQLAADGITVNNVAPALSIPTAIWRFSATPNMQRRYRFDSVGYYGDKDDLSGTVLLLCSDAGRYITGQSIYVDGGKSL
jgi:NAD(P)-dependent dehydrogenase (short-subunit alcohol dehydrogenase family)